MNDKIKEFKLTRRAKYGIVTLSLATVLGIGVAAFATDNDDVVVNNNNDNDQQVTITPDKPENDEPIVVVENEKLAKPFTVDATIKTYYFDANDESKQQENALIYYNGMYTPSIGVDYFYNNVAFDIVAAFSGTVVDKKVDPLYGATVSIKSKDNDLIAVYSSLSNITINVGDEVKQGDIIAKAGSNTINSNMGNHLNFSLIKNNKNINPLNYYSKEIKDI